jgi:hypothetical protein
MSLEEAVPTLEDLQQLPWQELTSTARGDTCSAYASALLGLRKNPGSPQWKASTLLAFVLSMSVDIDNESDPFIIRSRFVELGPSSLQAPHLGVLASWLPHVPAEAIAIKARIADILWLNRAVKREHAHGLDAVSAYIEEASGHIQDSQSFTITVQCLWRAFRIARRLGVDRESMTARVIELIETTLAARQTLTVGRRDVRLMDILQKYADADANKYAVFAREEAERLESQSQSEAWARSTSLSIARDYWRSAARWFRLAKDHGPPPTETADCLMRAAETHIKEADKCSQANQPLAEYSHLSDGITELRKCGESRQRLDTLVTRMRNCQRAAPRRTFSAAQDVTDVVRSGEARVAGKNLREALLALAMSVRVPSKAGLQEAAERHLEGSTVARLFPSMLTSADYRVVASMPAFSPPDYDDTDEDIANRRRVLEWHMWQEAEWNRVFECALIHGARSQILVEHNPSAADLLPFVSCSLLVPPGHERLFATALHAGLQGELIAAVHILVPQLENALRWVIEEHFDTPMLRHTDDGTQMVSLLKRVLSDPDLARLIGEDMLFVLDGLLIRQESTNLRNNLAHGLLADGHFGANALYLWALVFHLCVVISPSNPAFVSSATDETSSVVDTSPMLDLVTIRNTIATEQNVEALRGLVVTTLGMVEERLRTFASLDPLTTAAYRKEKVDVTRSQLDQIHDLQIMQSVAREVADGIEQLDKQIAVASKR